MSQNFCCQCNQTGNNYMDCQTKVNERLMTMKQYLDTCRCKPKDIHIDEDEFKRLTKVWDNSGFKYVVNEKTGQITFL